MGRTSRTQERSFGAYGCVIVGRFHGANIYFRCSKCFRTILRVFHADVAKVDLNIVMLHVFQIDVASVLSRSSIINEI